MITIRRITGAALLLANLLMVGNTLAAATVQAIAFRGQAVEFVDQVRLTMGNSGVQVVRLTIGYEIPSGTRLETPRGVRLQLLSSNNNIVQVGPNSDIRIAVSDTGEQYAVNRGSIMASKGRKKLDFFNITAANGRYQGAAEGTVFGVQVSESGVKFTRQEGVVRLVEQVPVNVAGAQQKKGRPPLTIGVQTQLSAQSPELTFQLGSNATPPAQFDTYASAASALENIKQQAIAAQDIWQVIDVAATLGGLHLEFDNPTAAIVSFTEALELNHSVVPGGLDPAFADNHTNLGYAYLDLGRPDLALQNFEQAIQTLNIIDPYSPGIADSLIDQAEAYEMLGDMNQSEQTALLAVAILEANIQFGREEFERLMAQEDEELYELMAYVAIEVAYLLDSLGWAYTYAGNEQLANASFAEVVEIEDFLEQTGFNAIF